MVILPSIVCALVPLIIMSGRITGHVVSAADVQPGLQVGSGHVEAEVPTTASTRNTMFAVGVGGLVFVPIFKTATHLPPYVGMMLSLGVCWVVSEILNKNADDSHKHHRSVAYALSKIDASSVLFFLGILLSIGALQSLNLLSGLAAWADQTIGNQDAIVMAIGLGSAIVDNVPLVAAAMGMYDLNVYPTDHKLWEFMAYCAGTGGSCLIIGSAAGVAVMGMEHINFMWYLKKISWLALIGYLCGAFVYLAVYALTHFG